MRARIIETALSSTLIAVFTQIIPFTPAHSGGSAPLELEGKIPLGNVVGRIDHMAIDLTHRRLFVAELGNGSVSVVDLDTQKVVRRMAGFKDPRASATCLRGVNFAGEQIDAGQQTDRAVAFAFKHSTGFRRIAGSLNFAIVCWNALGWACQLVSKRTNLHLWWSIRPIRLQHKQPHATWSWLRV
jgi:hypothetical protein